MTTNGASRKSAEAFRTISEVADALKLPQHVLRFWETRFTQIKPLKRAGGRRFYRPEDVELLGAIRQLLYGEGYTIKGVQRILREQGPRAVALLARQPAGSHGLERATPSDGHDARDPVSTVADEDGAASSAEDDTPPDLPRPTGATDTHAGGPFVAEGDLDRLRAVLRELAACRDLLQSARN